MHVYNYTRVCMFICTSARVMKTRRGLSTSVLFISKVSLSPTVCCDGDCFHCLLASDVSSTTSRHGVLEEDNETTATQLQTLLAS